MLGIASPELALAYILCVAAAVWCVVYALYFWTGKGRDAEKYAQADWDKSQTDMEKKTP